MEKITKTISCSISMDINQEIDLTKSEWDKLEKYLENHGDINQYEKVSGSWVANDMYELLYGQIDLESGDFSGFDGVEIED